MRGATSNCAGGTATAVANATVPGDQVDDFVTAFYLDVEDVDAIEQEDMDFYDLYEGRNKTQQPPTPRFAFTPYYNDGDGARGPSELPDNEEVILLENALALAFASHETTGVRCADTARLSAGEQHWPNSSEYTYGSKSAEGLSQFTERLGHQRQASPSSRADVKESS